MLVTCQSEGCDNAGIQLDVEVTYLDAETGETMTVDEVICGVCSQPIDTGDRLAQP